MVLGVCEKWIAATGAIAQFRNSAACESSEAVWHRAQLFILGFLGFLDFISREGNRLMGLRSRAWTANAGGGCGRPRRDGRFGLCCVTDRILSG